MIRNWIFHEPTNPTICERDSDKWRSMESGKRGFKNGVKIAAEET
jgi:hypothetical protein